MEIINTPSFALAVNAKGDKNSARVALVLPGRLDTKDYACFDSHLERLASQGFYAVAFDPPGTWNSPGGIELFTTTNYIKAVNELIKYFGNKPTFLLGHSRGGAIAILAGTPNPLVIGIAVIMSTYGAPTSPSKQALISKVELSYRDLPPGTEKTNQQKEFALPLSYFKDGEKYNVVEVLKSCTKPKLLFYGTDDEFTQPDKVIELFNIIPQPKIIHELKSNHDYRYHPKIIEEVNNLVGDFLTDNYF
jgi:pimeloyl-ACP methyl ester carboxylesterase